MSFTPITIYTDGSCLGNPGVGGWGALLMWQGQEKELSGNHPETTNNRMEIQAVIEALQALKRPCKVRLVTDSQYVINGATKWMAMWKNNGWKTSNKKKPVENKDLWQSLDPLLQHHHVDFEWVKGHNGDPYNERADKLALAAAQQLQASAS